MIIQPKFKTTGGKPALHIEINTEDSITGHENVLCLHAINVVVSGAVVTSEHASQELAIGVENAMSIMRGALRDLGETLEMLQAGGHLLGQAQLPTSQEPPTEEDQMFSSSLQANREAIRSEQLKEVEPILTWARGQIFDASAKPYLHKLYLSVHHEVGRNAILEMVRRAGLQAYACPIITGGYQDGHMEYKNRAKLNCLHHVCVHLPEI